MKKNDLSGIVKCFATMVRLVLVTKSFQILCDFKNNSQMKRAIEAGSHLFFFIKTVTFSLIAFEGLAADHTLK